jgi:multiple sugar transport system substrate-binding protein
MQIGEGAVYRFVSRNAFLKLDDFINGDYPLDTTIYLPGVLDPGQLNGEQWVMPKDFTPLGVYYNKRIFDEYDVPYPEDGWTWDQFLETAKSLTIDTNDDGNTDVWGVQLTANWTTGFEYWIYAGGGSLISEDGTQIVGVMDSPENVEAVKFYADMYNVHKVSPPPADFSLWAGGNSEFENGQAAMRLFGRWPQEGLKNNPEVDLAIVGLPVGKERANVFFWGGFGIFSGTKHPEAAWRFLRFYTGEQGSQVWKDWAIPGVESVAEEAGLKDDPIEGVWISELDHVIPRAYVFSPYWGESGDSALRKVLETVLTDPNVDIAELMTEAAQEAQIALEEAME